MEGNNHRILEGAINQDLGEQVSIKALEMVWARKQTRSEVGQEGSKTSMFNSELGIRMTKLRNGN